MYVKSLVSATHSFTETFPCGCVDKIREFRGFNQKQALLIS